MRSPVTGSPSVLPGASSSWKGGPFSFHRRVRRELNTGGPKRDLLPREDTPLPPCRSRLLLTGETLRRMLQVKTRAITQPKAAALLLCRAALLQAFLPWLLAPRILTDDREGQSRRDRGEHYK